MGTDGARSVFLVMVVDPRSAKIVLEKEVVAKDEGEARLKAIMGENIVDLDRMDIGCTCVIRDFVRPRKETQKVTISKEDDKDD